ncbi:MAG: hypothetical protein ACREE6_00855, partial [Limisphaerales bacterium]
MSNTDILGFASAIFCGGLAIIVAGGKQLSAVHWAFILGMLGLAAENVFFGLSIETVLPSDVLFWQKCRIITASCTSSVWLFFSVAYARWNHSDFLKSWRPVLVAAFVLPIATASFFGNNLIVSVVQTHTNQGIVRLGLSGAVLNAFSLLVAVLALMNLEATFRAATGTMLWRIKFIILGMGLIFIVRAYVSG